MTNHLSQLAELQSFIDIAEEQAAFDQLITEALLNEASTLMNMIGNRKGGEYLAKWLHVNHRLSADAKYSRITRKTGRVQWKQFKTDYSHFMIVGTDKMMVAIKPNTRYVKDRYENKDRLAGDTNLLYDIVAFANDERVDNLLVPFPKRDDYEKNAQGEEEFRAEVRRVSELRKRTLNPDAPATQISIRRGGRPFASDKERNPENIFDRIAEIGGNVNEIYVVSGGVDELNKKFGVSGNPLEITVTDPSGIEKGMSVTGKLFTHGTHVTNVDGDKITLSKPVNMRHPYASNADVRFEKLGRKKDIRSAKRASFGDMPGEVGPGGASWPSEPGVERGKMSRRDPDFGIGYDSEQRKSNAALRQVQQRLYTYKNNILSSARNILRRARVDRDVIDWFDGVIDNPDTADTFFNRVLKQLIDKHTIKPELINSAAAGNLEALKEIITTLRNETAELAKQQRMPNI